MSPLYTVGGKRGWQLTQGGWARRNKVLGDEGLRRQQSDASRPAISRLANSALSSPSWLRVCLTDYGLGIGSVAAFLSSDKPRGEPHLGAGLRGASLTTSIRLAGLPVRLIAFVHVNIFHSFNFAWCRGDASMAENALLPSGPTVETSQCCAAGGTLGGLENSQG